MINNNNDDYTLSKTRHEDVRAFVVCCVLCVVVVRIRAITIHAVSLVHNRISILVWLFWCKMHLCESHIRTRVREREGLSTRSHRALTIEIGL